MAADVVEGAQTVVASLWSVGDEATRTLMANFYKRWLPGGEAAGDVAKALQQAMDKLHALARVGLRMN